MGRLVGDLSGEKNNEEEEEEEGRKESRSSLFIRIPCVPFLTNSGVNLSMISLPTYLFEGKGDIREQPPCPLCTHTTRIHNT